MKSNFNFKLSLWALAVLLMVFIACNSDSTQQTSNDESSKVMNTDSQGYSDDLSRQLHGDVIGGEEGFIYSYADDPYYENDQPVNTSPSESTAANARPAADKVATEKNKINTSKTVPKVKAEPVIYDVSQTDRPPLFSSKCATDSNPTTCSKNELKKWVREYIEYPENAQVQNQEGVQYVTFVINQKGVISTITDVDSKGQPCDGCSSAAVKAVAQMPDWQPAMKDGKPVSVVVTLPIRFKML
jgi:hypothetical protein